MWLTASLLLLCAAAWGYFHEPLILAVPLVVAGALLLVQHPKLLLYVLLASIPWSIEFNFTESLGTDLPDEPLMLLTAFAAVVAVVHRRREVFSRRWHPLLQLLCIQFAWIAVTAALSSYPLLSFKYTLAKSWYLLAFVTMPLLLFPDEKVLRRAAAVLLSSMLLLMVVTLFRHAAYNWTFDKINKALEPFFRNHVNYSSLLVLMVPILLAVIRLTKDRRTGYFLKLVLVVTLGAIYFSYARGAWLALVAGTMTFILLRRRWLAPAYWAFLGLFLCGVLWLRSGDRYLAFSNDYKTTIFHTNFSEHLVATYQLKDVSTAERYYRWIAGVRMAGEGWQTGFGPSTFYNNYKSYTVPAFKTWVSRNDEHSTIHNYFLLLFVEQGLPGLLIFILLVAGMFRYAQRIYTRTDDPFWKAVASVVASILVMICTVNFLSDLIETDKVGSVFYLCLAALVVADRKTGGVSRRAAKSAGAAEQQ